MRGAVLVKSRRNVNVGRREMSKTCNGGNIFAADVCTHTHTHTHYPRVHTYTHTHTDKDTRTRSPTHTHRQTGCSECGSLGLALPQACGNSPEASSAVRLLPHATKKTPFTERDGRAIPPSITPAVFRPAFQTLTFPNCRPQPPCFAYLNVVSRWWGPGGLGRKTGGLLHITPYSHAQWRQ